MHFTKTIAAVFALAATVSALPLQKRQDDSAIGDPDSTFSLFYISAFANHNICIFSPSALKSHLPHQLAKGVMLTQISGPLDDLLTNIQGGLRGGLDFLSIPSGDGAEKAKRAEDIPGADSKLFSMPICVKGGAFADVRET